MNIYGILEEGIPYLIGITLVVGAFNLKKFWATPSSIILLYLLILFVTETIGGEIPNNHWLYNMSGVLELTTISIMFYLAIENATKRKYVLYIYVICLLFLLYECIFITKGIMQFWANGYGVISLGISIMCVIYMIELATTEKVLHLRRILLYWIVVGMLIYQLVNLPVTVLMNNLKEIGNTENILMIQVMAGFVMYICFIIGFIWTKKSYNS